MSWVPQHSSAAVFGICPPQEGPWSSYSLWPEPPLLREKEAVAKDSRGVDSTLVQTQGTQPSWRHCVSWAGPPDTAPAAPPQPGWCLCGKDFKSSRQTPDRERQRGLATMHSSCSPWGMLPQLPPLPLLLLLLLTATGPATALTEDEKQTMVELHNHYRAQVSPPASDMLQMVSVAGCPPPGTERVRVKGKACHEPFSSPPRVDALSRVLPLLSDRVPGAVQCTGPHHQPHFPDKKTEAQCKLAQA